MTQPSATPSARQAELLEAAYQYVLTHGLAALSLRPLAREIGTSPRVLLYLFGSKDGLVRALLARARAEELELLANLRPEPSEGAGSADPAGAEPAGTDGDRLAAVATRLWTWLTAEEHRGLLTLWLESYARSLVEPEGAWAGFARATVSDWLDVLAAAQPERVRHTAEGRTQRTQVLALLRGALLDLLATGDVDRTSAAVRRQLHALDATAAR